MSKRVFFDTNLLVYADDADAGTKTQKARELIAAHMREGTAVVSTQVLQEFFVVSTRKLGVPVSTARRKVDLLSHAKLVTINRELILEAIDLHIVHQLSFWDALILRAAAAGGCSRVLSEDMHEGATFKGVRVENPFR